MVVLTSTIELRGQFLVEIALGIFICIDLYNKLYKKDIDTSKIKKAIQETFYLKEFNRYAINTNSKSSSSSERISSYYFDLLVITLLFCFIIVYPLFSVF